MVLRAMRAARYDRYGAPDVLYEGSVPVPTYTHEEILVRVHAASVNSIDTAVRAGKLRIFTGRKFPRGTSLDFAGEISAVGAKTTGFQVGDRVWGALPLGKWGSAAEFITVPEEYLALSPTGVDLTLAAALPVVGATALIALRKIAKLQPGENLLVRGASGGVGMVAVQLGHALGANVTGLASSANLAFVGELGADRTFDYATTQPGELGSFDVILDAVGSELRRYRRLLAPKGRMITIAIDPKAPVAALLYLAADAVFGGRRVRFFSAKVSAEILNDLTSYVETGAIRPVVDTVYPLSEISAAHGALEKGGRRGKQIVALL
jgi:NADPH:quinone reductase-like Zn-dependent oxidoreductase